MPINYTKFSYENLNNDNVQFLQGTQAQLNKYFLGSGDALEGAAQEGAFYLTTDTHRLYVGRKIVSQDTNNGKIIPEEVSKNITTVANTGEVTNISVSGEARDGDFYYIKDNNILCVFEGPEVDSNGNQLSAGKWVQINSPTGIDEVVISAGDVTNGKTTLSVGVEAGGQSRSGSMKLAAGTNVTLAKTTETVGTASVPVITISSTDTNYTLSTDTDTNKGVIKLSDGTTNQPVHFVGGTDTSVESGTVNSVSTVTINGPVVEGTRIDALGSSSTHTGNTHGFQAVTVVNGTTEKTLSNNGSKIDPIINYGSSYGNSSYFYGGQAFLDVYSISEAQAEMDRRITSQLHTADAMVYKGVVDTALKLTDVSATGSVRKDASIGDTYKASADFAVDLTPNDNNYDTTSIKKGDLLIANGQEYQNTDSTNATTYTTDTALLGKIVQSTLYWDVVPSGDEPYLEGSVGRGTGNTQPYFALEDANSNNATVLKVTFDSANSTLITATGDMDATSPEKNFRVRLSHDTVARTDSTTATLATPPSADPDNIPDDGIQFFALSSTIASGKTSAITTDEYGHVTGVTGKVVNFKHNYVETISATHSVTSSSGEYTGRVLLGLTDNKSLTSATGSILLKSSTLKIENDGTSALKMNLVWGSF